MAKKISSITKELNRLLAQLNDEGGFTISVLTDSQGLAIAFAGQDGMDPERQSAIVAIVQKTISQVGSRLGMTATDEISVYDSLGVNIRPKVIHRFSAKVCHEFSARRATLVDRDGKLLKWPGQQVVHRGVVR